MGNETKSRFRLGSKISSIVLSVAMLATTFTGLGSTLVPQTSITVNAAGNYGLADNIQDGNILHCFCWKYDDIKDMLPEIAEAGFTSVQVSPPQATAGTGAWWWFYQPLGFYIGSNAMGNEQSLKALCSEAHNYGIKIIADVVANHLAGDHSNIQDDLKDGQYWHSEQYNADDGDRYRVTHGKIGMPDLATENSHVQDCVIKYLAQLKSAGVDGIRFDAAKHIGLPSEGDQFWARVTASTDLWSYGEILNNPGISLDEGASTRQQAINVMKEYSNYIGITDSVYGKLLRDELAKGKFPDSPSVYAGAWMGIANTRLVYWGESHDTWSNNDDWGSSRNVDQNVIDRAYAIAGSRNHIAALYLSRPFSKDKDSIMIGAKGSTHFTSKEVAAVNHYKNALNGQDDYYTTGGGCGVVCRAGGAVVALASGGNTDVTVPNGGGTVTPGTYTDEISGSTWTVTATQMTGHIGESGIAVFYKGGAVGGSVSASPSTGSFETTLSVTLNCSDATNTTYSTSEGASGSFTNGQKITIGSSTTAGSSVTLTLKGTGASGKALSQTYTYKKVKAGEKVYVYMDNSSYNWSSVYAYVYDESSGTAKEMAKWPGTKLTDKNSKGYFKLDVTAYKDNGQVIFSDGTNSDANRYPADKMPGMKIAGSSKLFSAGNKWADYSDVVIPPTTDPDVTVDKASGTSFTTETLDITLSLANATKGTYSIDNGPEKTFTSTTKVTIGEGKIGDSDVTVKVTATDGSKTTNKTLTYSKKYVKKTTSTSASLANVYKTNPTGLGKQATITIDGDASDWSEDMLIAQGAAWDVANHWKGGHENCVLDTYALFAAWDDTNLYIGWQMVNTTDTWANSGDGPLSDGGRVLDVPLILALSLSSSSVGMTNKNTAGGSIWGQKMGLTFTTHVDRLFYMSGKPGLGKPSMFAPADAQGNTDYDPPYCVGFADGGIEYKMATTNICSKIIGLNSSDDPADVFDNSADWVDYKTMNHDTKYDSFYEIKIPLATLGITKDYITSNGIGAMLVATRGESALDCIPYDPSMVDNAKGDYSADPSTSEEKEDIDNITVPLACIGKGEIGGGDDIIIPTPDTLPLQVNFGTDRSAPQLSTTALTIKGIGYGGTAPYKYEFSVDGKVVKASNTTATVSWKPTTNGQHTLKCVITDSKGKTATATKTFTSEGGSDIIVIDELLNSSSLSSTSIAAGGSLTMKGSASGGTSPYTYAYLYKSSSASSWTTVKGYSSATSVSATISTAGSYQACIKVKDSAGTEVKKFIDFTVTGGTSSLTNKSTVSATTVTLGNAVTVKCAASGGKSPYKYAVLYKASSASSWTTKQDFSATTSVAITFSGAGTKNICVKVKDSSGTVEKKYFDITVKAASLTNNSTVSATSIALGSTIKATAKATGGTSPYTYQIVYKKSNQSNWTTASAYSTTATANIKPSSTGSYQICIKVKDKTGTEVKKFFDITVKAALANNSTMSATSVKLGSTVTLKGAATGGSGYYNFAMLYKKTSDSTWTTAQAYKSNTTVSIKPAKATTYDVCIKVKDSANTEVKKYFTLKVTSAAALVNNSTVSATSVKLGNSITVKGAATGGTAPYKYAFFYKASSASTWTTKQDFSTTASVSIKFTGTGTKDVCVKVKDNAGTVVKKYFTVKVTSSALANNSTVSATSVTLGNSVTVKCAATGGTSPYKYAIFYKASSSDTWSAKQDFSSTTSASIKFTGKGTKDICVKVKDNAGTVVKKYFTITVK